MMSQPSPLIIFSIKHLANDKKYTFYSILLVLLWCHSEKGCFGILVLIMTIKHELV